MGPSPLTYRSRIDGRDILIRSKSGKLTETLPLWCVCTPLHMPHMLLPVETLLAIRGIATTVGASISIVKPSLLLVGRLSLFLAAAVAASYFPFFLGYVIPGGL